MSIRSKGIPPRQFPQAPQMQQRMLPAAAMGDPGYGTPMSGGVSPADLRRLMGPIESTLGDMQNRLAAVEARGGGGADLGAIAEMLRVSASPGFTQSDILSGLGQDVIDGIRFGRALPYFAGIDVFVPKGVSGVTLPAGEIYISSDGPFFITELLAYAQIDADDPDAANYPMSLIRSPSCSDADAACPDVFASADSPATFTASPQSLVPSLNAQGMFIPVGMAGCSIVSPTVETVCYTLDCADGSAPRKFAAQVPIVLLDHPDCVSGLVDMQTNGCQWQNQSFPIDFMNSQFNITANTPPNVLGVVGYLDCNKRLDVRFQPTRPMRFDVNLTFLFAGFRVITCGTGACGVG